MAIQRELFTPEESEGPVLRAVANKIMAEAAVGRILPVELFMLQLWGRRVIVVREEAEAKIGSIIIPERNQAAKSAGWVISCGPEVGMPEHGVAGWSPYSPKDLLLKKVFFGRYAGIALPVMAQNEDGTWEVPRSDMESEYIMMTDLDILANFEEEGV